MQYVKNSQLTESTEDRVCKPIPDRELPLSRDKQTESCCEEKVGNLVESVYACLQACAILQKRCWLSLRATPSNSVTEWSVSLRRLRLRARSGTVSVETVSPL